MITDWFIQQGLGMVGWISSFFPKNDALGGLVLTPNNGLTTIVAGAGSLGVWIPWAYAATLFGILTALYIVALVFRLARVVAGHVPFIGGNG